MKKGHATPMDYKDVVTLCGKKIRSAKAQLECYLTIAVKDNKNVPINTLAKKEGLRRISILFEMWGIKH